MSAAGSPVLVQRRAELPPDLASAGEARRLLRGALREAGHEGWSDAAELACSEVVTNAVLHAHTAFVVTVTVRAEAVRVEVRDGSTALPLQRGYDTQATTGRGMALVAALSRSHGVADVDDSGKTVWFEVGGAPEESSEEALLEAWADAEWDLADLVDAAAARQEPGTRSVVLRGMPPTLWLAAGQHHDALLRELVLHLAEHEHERDDVHLAAADRARGRLSTAMAAAVAKAQQDGTAVPAVPPGHPSPLPWVPASLDLHLDLPVDLAPAFGALQDTLDVAEGLAAAGRLLCRPGLPEVVAVRDWACEQVVAQLAGSPPAPWPGTDQERFLLAARSSADDADPEEWDLAGVDGSARGVVAADDANRIVAVSEPLLAVLGWEREDLVGRRVVAVVPPHLREAHVAGFSRHLSTGEAHVLGVPVELPVLRRDGTEVPCTFVIERRSSGTGRQVYVAWIEPRGA